MEKKIKIAMGQLLVEGGEPDRNIERAKSLIEEASKNNSNLILLPECLDFGWTHPSSLKNAEPIPGKFSNIFCDLAKNNNIYICAGLTEKYKNKNYNSAILIDNKGNILSKYRKINILKKAFEYYEVGQSLSVVDTIYGKIGLNICSDNYLDSIEIGIVLARMGANIILTPSSWTVDYSITEEDDPYKEKWIKPYKILSSTFNMAVVSTTSVGYIVGGPFEGRKMIGCSVAINKNEILTKAVFNEFASDIKYIEFDVPNRKFKGTEIGEALTAEKFYSWN